MRLGYEPTSEPLHIYVQRLFVAPRLTEARARSTTKATNPGRVCTGGRKGESTGGKVRHQGGKGGLET